MDMLQRIYRASSPPMKWQLWATCLIVGVVCVAVVSGQAPATVTSGDAWFTPQNLISLGILLYGVGTTIQAGRDVKRRVERLEKCVDEDLPATYVRKDVFEERLRRRTADILSPGQQ